MKRRDLLKAIPALLTVPSANTKADTKEIPVDLEKVECKVKYERRRIKGFRNVKKDCSFLLCPDCGREIYEVSGRSWPLIIECSDCKIRLFKASVATNESGAVKVEYYKHKIIQPNLSD